LAHYYRFGRHRPGATDLADKLKRARPLIRMELGGGFDRSPVLDTPEALATFFEGYEEAGVDQVAFFHQAGRTKHDHIMEALELFGERAMPAFEAREEQRALEKAERLEGVVEAAFARKKEQPPEEGAPEEIDAFTRGDFAELLAKLKKYVPDI